MLDKNITYEVRYGDDLMGEIKGNVYYGADGRREHEIRDNCLFDDDQKIGVFSSSEHGLILTRFENDTVLSVREKK